MAHFTAVYHKHSMAERHPFNGIFSRTIWVSWHAPQSKPFWILMKQETTG